MIERFFGAALIAIGAMIALLSGGCTGVVVFANIRPIVDQHAGIGPGLLTALVIPLVVGAPFIALGIALCVTGVKLMRRRLR